MVLFIYVTFEDQQEAEKIGELLVKEKLVACVNILPKIKSMYFWKKRFVKTDETMMIAKCPEKNYHKAEHMIRQLHSAELPEIVAIKVDRGLHDYLSWVRELE